MTVDLPVDFAAAVMNAATERATTPDTVIGECITQQFETAPGLAHPRHVATGRDLCLRHPGFDQAKSPKPIAAVPFPRTYAFLARKEGFAYHERQPKKGEFARPAASTAARRSKSIV
jgi:hypothetical protein